MKVVQGSVGVVCLILASTIAMAGQRPPKLVVEQPMRALGTVAQGEVLEIEYVIVNPGDQTLQLSVRPTCGCTVASFDREIQARGRGHIVAKVDTSRFEGTISKSLLVSSNDPERPSLRLVVTAEVEPILVVRPRPLVRLDATHGQGASERVVIAANGAHPEDFTITGITSGAPYLSAVARRLADSEGGSAPSFEISIQLAGDAPSGLLNVPLTVHTDHPRAKTVNLKVTGRVSG
jgi:hypothetical protein